AQNQLPHVTLQLPDLSPEQSKQLQSLDEMPVSEVLKVLINKSSKPMDVDMDEDFRWQLYNAFIKLVDVVGDHDSMMTAMFSARQFEVRCQHGGSCAASSSCSTCKFYSIRALRNIHASPTRQLKYIPLSFFSVQQQLHAGLPDDKVFARKVEQQFGHLRRDAKASMGPSLARGRSTSPAGSNRQGAESPRTPIFRNPLRRSVVSRRSDEATIVDHETGVADASDTEMSRARSFDEDYPSGEVCEAESPRKTWVSDAFGLFQMKQMKCEPGWASARPGGWKWDISVENSLVVVNLIDSYALTLPSLYISTLLLSLRSMLQLDMTHINVLTKIDNLSKYPPLPFNLDFYTEVQDLSYLLPSLEEESPMFGQEKYAALNEAIVNLVEEFGLVGYETLAVEDKKSMMSLLRTIDRAGGYAFGGAEGANDTVWQVAVREGMGGMDVRDVQERWIDQKDEWDERERMEWEEEQKRREEEWERGVEDGGIGDDVDGDDLPSMTGDSGVKVKRRAKAEPEPGDGGS
ncbi:hypothetical protein LTR40_007731, partial [Exophiala xenobiotica]